MKNNKEKENLDIDFKGYFEEKNPVLHRQAIERLLEKADLEDFFVDFLEGGEDEITNFFLMWETAGELEKNPIDKKGLQKLGILSKEFYRKKEYKKLHELFFDMMFRNFAEFADLKNRKDFKNITDVDLYSKGIVPSEIFFQYFLMESPLKMEGFDWSRSEEVMMQNLACLVVCFSDIYDFFNECEKDES